MAVNKTCVVAGGVAGSFVCSAWGTAPLMVFQHPTLGRASQGDVCSEGGRVELLVCTCWQWGVLVSPSVAPRIACLYLVAQCTNARVGSAHAACAHSLQRAADCILRTCPCCIGRGDAAVAAQAELHLAALMRSTVGGLHCMVTTAEQPQRVR
jgi:hypothetical protein